MASKNDSQYFATLPPYSVEVASALMSRVDRFYAWLPDSFAYQRARRCWQAWYGLPSEASPFDVSTLHATGEKAELTQLNNNILQTVGRRALSRIVQTKPSWQPVGANGERITQAQAAVARSILDWEMRDKAIESVLYTCAETAYVWDTAYILPTWDLKGGGVYDPGSNTLDPETGKVIPGQPIYNGELKLFNLRPYVDVILDVQRQDSKHQWAIVKRHANKWDLATRYPGQRDVILGLPVDHKAILDNWHRRGYAQTETDEVPYYTLFHRPTDSVPEGREITFVDDKTILFDGPSVDGRGLPLIRMAPGDMIGTPFGSTPTTNALALQELFNILLSSAATNNVNGGVANLAIPKDADLSPLQLLGGQNVWEYDGPTPPVPITFAHTAPETFQMAGLLKEDIISALGQSDVSMGKGDPQLSGAAMVLLDQRTMEFVAPFQASYRRGLESLGTAIIRKYRQFKKTPRDLEVIVGESNSYLLKDFTGASISDIDAVSVESKNALADTVAGRMDMAEKLLQLGSFQGPNAAKDLLQVLNTGNLQTLLDGPEKKALLIKAENEQLSRGEMPIVKVTDDHLQHIFEHDTVTATPEARKDMELMGRVSAHQNEHLMILCSPDPAVGRLLMSMGQRPLPPLPPPGMPMQPMGPVAGGPGMQPPNGPGMGAPAASPQGPQKPVGQAMGDTPPNGPRPPQPPKNLETGNRWNPQDGGAA